MTWASMVVVGRVVRPHGLRGQVVVVSETDFGDTRFAAGATVWCESNGALRELTVTGGRPQGDRWVVGFEGLESVEDAEGMRGVELRIPEAARMPLADDQYYLYDLVGCQVRTTAGEDVGKVLAVYTGAGGALLGVERDGSEVLVPLVKAMCPVIDVTGRRIEVDPPEGLFDVNVPTAKAAGRGRGEQG
jgi:16S rRNA processing protein RimM